MNKFSLIVLFSLLIGFTYPEPQIKKAYRHNDSLALLVIDWGDGQDVSYPIHLQGEYETFLQNPRLPVGRDPDVIDIDTYFIRISRRDADVYFQVYLDYGNRKVRVGLEYQIDF